MSKDVGEYQGFLRSTVLVGGASVAAAVFSVAKAKLLAIWLGPAGIGVASLLISFMTLASAMFALGLRVAGTQLIAEGVTKGVNVLSVLKVSLFNYGWALAAIAGATVWILREPMALVVFGSEGYADQIAWLAVGVFFSVVVNAQWAWLQGLADVRRIALLTVLSSMIGFAGAASALWLGGKFELVAYAISAPLGLWIVGVCCVSRKHAIPVIKTRMYWRDQAPAMFLLLQMGIPLLGAHTASASTHFWMKSEINRYLGAASLGNFEAGWSISMQYVALILSGLAVDYYPKLVQKISNSASINSWINRQIEFTLFIATPIFIVIVAFAPQIIVLMYSTDFAQAHSVLRWQVLGDVLKVVTWPLGLALLAKKDLKTYFWIEASTLILMGLLTTLLLKNSGLAAAGIAYLTSYALYGLILLRVLRNKLNFRLSNQAITSVILTSIYLVVILFFSKIEMTTLAAVSMLIIYACVNRKAWSNILRRVKE